MAAFSYHPHPFFLDSVFLPNSAPIKGLSGFMEEGNIIPNNNPFSQFYTPMSLLEAPLDVRFHESCHLDQNFKVSEPSSLTPKQSTDSSTVVDRLESGEQVTQKVVPMVRKRRNSYGSSSVSVQSKDPRDVLKSKKQKKCSGEVKEEEKKSKAEKKDEKKVAEEPPMGYIHVRARRGQATDSHSLAERVRREKISERMKILQQLVPGCDKVTGKALMLDEIINYVQSLQNQVEFLSMKLASVNPLFYDFGMDLDAFMVRPERLTSMASSPLQQCSPTQSTVFAADSNTSTPTTFLPPNHHNPYPLIDTNSSTSLLLLQGHRSSDFTQDGGSVMWDMEEQRQKFLNPSLISSSTGFTTNLCSFH